MGAKHTAGPWREDSDPLTINIRGADGKPIAELWIHEDTKANAEFIVRACNAHDELVKALQKARARIGHLTELPGFPAVIASIDAALSAAGAA